MICGNTLWYYSFDLNHFKYFLNLCHCGENKNNWQVSIFKTAEKVMISVKFHLIFGNSYDHLNFFLLVISHYHLNNTIHTFVYIISNMYNTFCNPTFRHLMINMLSFTTQLSLPSTFNFQNINIHSHLLSTPYFTSTAIHSILSAAAPISPTPFHA